VQAREHNTSWILCCSLPKLYRTNPMCACVRACVRAWARAHAWQYQAAPRVWEVVPMRRPMQDRPRRALRLRNLPDTGSHICAETAPHLRRDCATSAPGLRHICAGTAPHLRRDLYSPRSAPELTLALLALHGSGWALPQPCGRHGLSFSHQAGAADFCLGGTGACFCLGGTGACFCLGGTGACFCLGGPGACFCRGGTGAWRRPGLLLHECRS
jgi:hypothetical protein